jgi:hypothetical protein
VACLLAVVVTLCAAGCSETGAAGTTQITGIVTLDGTTVDQASVAFIGNAGARLASAQTDKQGKFTVRAALGKNVVTVSKAGEAPIMPAQPEDMLMPSVEEYTKMQKAAPKPGIPAKYADPTSSGLSFDIVDGMQEIELALSSK